MKKLLLFLTILALSICAFSQSKRPVNQNQFQKSIFIEKAQHLIKSSGLKIPGMTFELNQDQSVTQQLSGPIQIQDSSINWKWSTSASGWERTLKYMNMVYDVNNNMISELGKKWNGSSWEDSLQETNTYDASHRPLSSIAKSWNGKIGRAHV